MYNIDTIVKIYFNCVPVQSILEGEIKYSRFPQKEFIRLAKVYFPGYTDTENHEMYEMIKESIRIEGHPYARMKNRGGDNVFAALEEVAEQLLTTEDDTVLCQYNSLLRYREVTNEIEEDLLVCAYLAMCSERHKERHFSFSWNTTLGHNNVQLSRIMERGISENHFHLYGSAPAYQLIWVDIMNRVNCKEFHALFDEMNARPRKIRQHYYTEYHEEGYKRKVLKAALIRVHLTIYLLQQKMGKSKKLYSLSRQQVKRLLVNEDDIEGWIVDIQNVIDYLKDYAYMTQGIELRDYALFDKEIMVREDKAGNYKFAGERWLIYQMLTKEFHKGDIPEEILQWFYAYLVIKSSFRGEMVQVNNTIGFENFSIYSRRKKQFHDWSGMIRSAVYGSLASGNINSLEIRLAPAKTAKENEKLIDNLEAALKLKEGEEKDLDKIYYVFHFSKSQEPDVPENYECDEIQCRHYKKRRYLSVQTNAIIEFRKNSPIQAAKVYGIDACAQEIGCRPEVFAAAFRYLAEDVQTGYEHENVRQLKMTYHVGEDFLDVVDGLRAIDEAVNFLELQCGDRIGHGTVLGIDVKKWYRRKQNTILISQQDYLDNVVWLHQKLVEFDISETDILREYLKEQFDIYFSRIYMDTLLHENKSQELQGHITIRDYYEAWKLRGDAPELYKNKRFNEDVLYEHRDFMISQKTDTFRLREREEICTLYYLYHYSAKVRREGNKVEEVYMKEMYIKGAQAVQKKMQEMIAKRGIAIETNPSSNLSISTMETYGEHPIIQMYNKNLLWDVEKLQECPQINVSINTDDKGLFHTSLENEYALMACALEKEKDENGKHIYNRQMIYQWIDDIRKMGNMQRFNSN